MFNEENVENKILDIIAVEVSLSNHGNFLRLFATVWQKADPFNKNIIKPAWKKFIDKYGFRVEYAEAIKRELARED